MNNFTIILHFFFYQFVSTGCHNKPRCLPDDRGQIHDKDRQRTYKLKSDALSLNQRFRGKARSTAYSECVPVSVVVKDVMGTRRIKLSPVGLSGFTIFFHIIP
jgi:hypothetical protein